jgi:hypothetical protein
VSAGLAFADAYAPGERDPVLAGVERPFGAPQAQIFGDLDRLRKRLLLEQQGELIAAEAPNHGPV